MRSLSYECWMEILEVGWIIKNIGDIMGKRSDELEYDILFMRRSMDDK